MMDGLGDCGLDRGALGFNGVYLTMPASRFVGWACMQKAMNDAPVLRDGFFRIFFCLGAPWIFMRVM
jgi:hypothetical protein